MSDETKAVVGARAKNVFRAAIKNGIQTLESITTLERGKFGHRPRNEPRFFGGSHPVDSNRGDRNANKFIHRWSQTLNHGGLAISKKFPRGTVLIRIAATIGAVGILDFDCWVPDSIVGMTPRVGTDSGFIYHYLVYLREHLEDIAPQSAQKNINLQILSSLPVPTFPLAEECGIAVELNGLQEQMDTLKKIQTETNVELDALLPSILDTAFDGEI